jgi:hypothetical protein
MRSLSLTCAFARYGAKLSNPQWAVSALNNRDELVISCWSHYLSPHEGSLRYEDRLSRWEGNKHGTNLIRGHLNQALAENLSVRLVIARTTETDLVDSGHAASNAISTFGVREDLVGKVVTFDGDTFIIDFVRRDV